MSSISPSARNLLLPLLLMCYLVPALSQSMSFSYFSNSSTCSGPATGSNSGSTALMGGNYVSTTCYIGGGPFNPFSFLVLCAQSSNAYYISYFSDLTCVNASTTYASTSGGCDQIGPNQTSSLLVTCFNPSSADGAFTISTPLVALLVLVSAMMMMW